MAEIEKPRTIQEYVPGKQVTMAHLIANPLDELCKQIGVENKGAIGIMTITPGEGTIIAADAASKAGDIRLEFVDRFTGCLVFSGNVAAVESALNGAVRALERILGFTPASVTKS
jgi:ethanolamine utilization protein EutS